MATLGEPTILPPPPLPLSLSPLSARARARARSRRLALTPARAADAFLADIGSDDEEEAAAAGAQTRDGGAASDAKGQDGAGEAKQAKAEAEEAADEVAAAARQRVAVEPRALLNDPDLRRHLAAIDAAADAEASADAEAGLALIVRSNEFARAAEEHIGLVHKQARELYAAKHREFEELVPSPVEYARVVMAVGNETDLHRVDLSALLPAHLILTLTVTASTSKSPPLPPEQLARLRDVCGAIIDLDALRSKVRGRGRGRAPSLR